MKTSSLPQSLQHYMSRPSVVSHASTRATPGQAMSPLCAHRSCPCVCVGQCYAFEHERICRCCDVLTCNDCPSRMQDPRLQFQSSRAHLDLARACFGTTVGVPLSSHAQRRWTCPRRNIAQPAACASCRDPCIEVGGCLGCGSGSGSPSARGASGICPFRGPPMIRCPLYVPFCQRGLYWRMSLIVNCLCLVGYLHIEAALFRSYSE